ncbi:hypothetical protein SPI_04801 [Niveomyces insectorum RCEF 264]|uniref:Uncharacterized protein n=1 Tax=Niveomyces insectorum RCEF 264 TaxID=1081102 RepID=A0A167UVB1_9HYPO|nr:hypothetical protein SPI_04801 [Niveomyces insectorum RCEF 264]
MTPPCYTFPASELTEHVQLDVHGRTRKMPLGPAPDGSSSSSGGGGGSARQPANRHRDIDLARDCTLLSSLVQYSCTVLRPERRDSPVQCWPVQRLFRRCQDRAGYFMVETTAWEGSESVRPSGSSRSSSSNSVTDAGRREAARTAKPLATTVF